MSDKPIIHAHPLYVSIYCGDPWTVVTTNLKDVTCRKCIGNMTADELEHYEQNARKG